MHCDCKFVQPEFKDWKIVSDLSLPEPRIFHWGRKIAKTGETDISAVESGLSATVHSW
jgi:hypothetical protein